MVCLPQALGEKRSGDVQHVGDIQCVFYTFNSLGPNRHPVVSATFVAKFHWWLPVDVDLDPNAVYDETTLPMATLLRKRDLQRDIVEVGVFIQPHRRFHEELV